MRNQQLFTLDEIAERIHKTRRWLREYLRSHPYYRKAGRTILMTEIDVTQLLASFESRPSKPAKKVPHKFQPTGGDMLEVALAMAAEKPARPGALARRAPKRSKPAGA